MSGFDPELFMRQQRAVGHNAAIGLRCHAFGANWVEVALDPDPGLSTDVDGRPALGPILSALDMATSLSIWVRSGAFVDQATLDMRVDYLRAPAPGRIIHARGECYRMGKRLAFVRGAAHDGDPSDPLANTVGTFLFLNPRA